MTDTIRENIMNGLVDIMSAMKDGEPVADPYTTTWSVVGREPIEQLTKGKKHALGIYEGTETKTPRASTVMDCSLRAILEFHVYVESAQKASSELNRVLGEVQRKIMEDTSIGSLAIDIVENGNEFDIDGMWDKQVSGALFVTIKYRHHIEDPRASV